jgi:polar amino acid transport system substrate-binding protein
MLRRALMAGALAWPWKAGAWSLPGQAALDVVFDDGSVPTMYKDAQGTGALGLYPALVGAALAGASPPVRLRAQPFKRVLSELMAGTAVAGAVIRTPEREQRCLFSQPYFIERLSVFSLRGRAPVFRRLSDLNGRRVGVIRGWSYGAGFDQPRARGDFLCEDVASDALNFEKLVRQRLDYVVATELGGRLHMQRVSAGDSAIVEGEQSVAATPIHLAVLQTAPGAGEFLSHFDQQVVRLVNNGTAASLMARELDRAARLMS